MHELLALLLGSMFQTTALGFLTYRENRSWIGRVSLPRSD